jgi:pilus assembly protein CpaC
VLAEPNIVAMDGKEASFLAGGEYPYPTVQGTTNGSGAITIMFKEYGVRLNFIPTIMPNGNIRLQVAPEVSALDFGDAVEVSGFQVPAITTRKVNTEVELGDGETFVIGGLLDNRETETFEKIPFLGDIPILGKFFQSKATNRTNTEFQSTLEASQVLPGTGNLAGIWPDHGLSLNTQSDRKCALSYQHPGRFDVHPLLRTFVICLIGSCLRTLPKW